MSGTTRRTKTRSRGYRERNVILALEGVAIRLTVEERREAVHRLWQRNLHVSVIAEMLGVTTSSVYKDLQEWTPRDAQHPTLTHDEMVEVVCGFAADQRDVDAHDILDRFRFYADADREALFLAALAMIPIETHSPQQLLAWTYQLVGEEVAA